MRKEKKLSAEVVKVSSVNDRLDVAFKEAEIAFKDTCLTGKDIVDAVKMIRKAKSK
jgi:hypothetical protein